MPVRNHHRKLWLKDSEGCIRRQCNYGTWQL